VEPGLDALALVPRPWSAEALERSLDAVILRDDAKLPPLTKEEEAALERAVANGATLVFRATDQASLARLEALAPPLMKIEKAPGPPVPARSALGPLHALDLLWPPGPGALRDVFSRYDSAPLAASASGTIALVESGALVERPFGRGRVLVDLVRWREAAPALPQARRWFSQLFSFLGAETHEPPIRLPANVWGGVGRRGDVVYFASNSTAQARFVARRAGRYKVHVDLGGTRALGGWPVARVVCDARFLGDVTLDGPGPRRYDLEVTIPAGVHVLSVSFTNDVYDPPEDRDMMLKGAVLELLPAKVY
ncbi:hypothetical protein HY251_15995, partial [bacterium]|nr:hypothetical protein [bacterium]